MTHKFKSAQERRKDWIDCYVFEAERRKIYSSVASRAFDCLAFCLIMFFGVSFIVHSFHWMNEEGYVFSAARIVYVFAILSMLLTRNKPANSDDE